VALVPNLVTARRLSGYEEGEPQWTGVAQCETGVVKSNGGGADVRVCGEAEIVYLHMHAG